jgi:hypothetical protein
MSTKPIPPDEIVENLDKIIPSQIIEAVNDLLKEKYRGGGSVSIKTDAIINLAHSKGLKIKREEFFEKKYLHFEPIFRKSGWVVTYESPDRDQNFDPYFNFKVIK